MTLPSLAAIAAAAAAVRVRLIPDAAAAWRLWSVRLAALGALLTAAAAGAPEALLAAWQALPDELRSSVPAHVERWITPTLFAAVLIARLVRQREVTRG